MPQPCPMNDERLEENLSRVLDKVHPLEFPTMLVEQAVRYVVDLHLLRINKLDDSALPATIRPN